jgi:hypothetical protein
MEGGRRADIVVHHARFVADAGISPGTEHSRAIKETKKYIDKEFEFHGYIAANRPVKKSMPYFLTREEGWIEPKKKDL